MARERDDDYDDRDDDAPPARRRRDRDDDYDDGYDRPAKPGGMDGFMGNMAVVIIFALFGVFCCPLISAILGGVGLATCKTPDGKRNSTIVLVAGLAGILLNVVLFATGALDGLTKQKNP